MAFLGWSVLLLVFVDEVLAIAAAVDWGTHQGGAWLGGAAGLLTMLVWYVFASPRAPLCVAFSAGVNALAQLPSVQMLVRD